MRTQWESVGSIAWIESAVPMQDGSRAVVMCDDNDRVHVFTADEALLLAEYLALAADMTGWS